MAAFPAMEEVTGLSLKLERIGRRVTARRLARAMGVAPSRVSHIEAAQFPAPSAVARYRQALETLEPAGRSPVVPR